MKQTLLGSSEAEEDDLNEGKQLSLLASFRSKHILRMYGPIRRDVFDKRKVLRLFLEYCPGHDLTQFAPQIPQAGDSDDDGEDSRSDSNSEVYEDDDVDATSSRAQTSHHGSASNSGSKREPGTARSSAKMIALQEADIWAMFHCLALGVSVLDHGSESDTVNPRLGGQISHNE